MQASKEQPTEGDPMTDAELQAFRQAMELLPTNFLEEFDDPFQFCERVVRWHNNAKNIPQAVSEELQTVHTWRVENSINTLLQQVLPLRDQFHEFWPLRVFGCDNDGHVVVADRLCDINVDGLLKMPRAPVLQLRAQSMECIEYLKGKQRLQNPTLPKRTKHVYIIDVRGLQMMKFVSARTRLKELLDISSHYYVDAVWKIFVVNAPKIFSTIWSAVQLWAPPRTREKVHILGDDKNAILRAFEQNNIPLSAIPSWLGGENQGQTVGEIISHIQSDEAGGQPVMQQLISQGFPHVDINSTQILHKRGTNPASDGLRRSNSSSIARALSSEKSLSFTSASRNGSYNDGKGVGQQTFESPFSYCAYLENRIACLGVRLTEPTTLTVVVDNDLLHCLPVQLLLRASKLNYNQTLLQSHKSKPSNRASKPITSLSNFDLRFGSNYELPQVVDDATGSHVCGPHATMRFICGRFASASQFYPANLKVDDVLLWAIASLYPCVASWRKSTAEGSTACEQVLAELESYFLPNSKRFLLGLERPTIADFAVAVYVNVLIEDGFSPVSNALRDYAAQLLSMVCPR